MHQYLVIYYYSLIHCCLRTLVQEMQNQILVTVDGESFHFVYLDTSTQTLLYNPILCDNSAPDYNLAGMTVMTNTGSIFQGFLVWGRRS